MINVRRFTISDIKPLWQLKLNTIHNVNSQHYSLAEVTAWAPHEYNESAWVQRVTKLIRLWLKLMVLSQVLPIFKMTVISITFTAAQIFKGKVWVMH